MQPKKLINLSFLLLTAINIGVSVFRDRFHYKPLSSYSSLYGTCDNSCENKWGQYKDDYPVEELAEAKKISDSLLVTEKTTYGKIIGIAKFIYEKFHKQSGKPTSDLLDDSPLTHFKKLSAFDSLELWCGNFAQMFSFFCWSQGIVCRNIEILNPGDHHVLNECFVPEEGRWIMVDVTNNMLLVQSTSASILNLEDFQKNIRTNGPIIAARTPEDSITLQTMSKNESFIKNYYLKENPAFYYHRVDNEKVYSAGNKIKRYLLPVSCYEILNDKGESNFPFYLKASFMVLWIISFFVFIIGHAKFRK